MPSPQATLEQQAGLKLNSPQLEESNSAKEIKELEKAVHPLSSSGLHFCTTQGCQSFQAFAD